MRGPEPSERSASREGPLALLRSLSGRSWPGALLSACGSSGRSDSITLYSGQHEQTTEALVSAFERATGITVNVRLNDEDTLANQIVVEGSHSPADVIFTENSPALEYLQEKGLLSPVDESTLADTPSQYNSPEGDWVGVSRTGERAHLQPEPHHREPAPDFGAAARRPQVHGQAGLRGRRDRLPADRDLGARDLRQGSSAQLARGDQVECAADHVYPDNETITNKVNRGAVAFGVINQYYWYRLRAEIGASSMHSQITYFAPRDPGYVLDVSGAAVLKSSKHQADAQRFLAFLVSTAGPGDHRPLDQLRVPDSVRGHDRPTRDSLRSTAAEPDHHRRSRRRLRLRSLSPAGRCCDL